jgi:hypothetical protein
MLLPVVADQVREPVGMRAFEVVEDVWTTHRDASSPDSGDYAAGTLCGGKLREAVSNELTIGLRDGVECEVGEDGLQIAGIEIPSCGDARVDLGAQPIALLRIEWADLDPGRGSEVGEAIVRRPCTTSARRPLQPRRRRRR